MLLSFRDLTQPAFSGAATSRNPTRQPRLKLTAGAGSLILVCGRPASTRRTTPRSPIALATQRPPSPTRASSGSARDRSYPRAASTDRARLATGGKNSFPQARRKAHDEAETVAVGCLRLPETFHGKSGVCHGLPKTPLRAGGGRSSGASKSRLAGATRDAAACVRDLTTARGGYPDRLRHGKPRRSVFGVTGRYRIEQPSLTRSSRTDDAVVRRFDELAQNS